MADESPNVGFEAAEDFWEAYANHVYYESSAWDLKLIFGQLDQSEGKIRTVQHTAITVPWAQAKIMSYWLRGQIEAHELVNGKIPIPLSIFPPEVPTPPKEILQADPNAEAVFAIFRRIRAEFIKDAKS